MKNKKFNPMTDVPNNEEQVIEALRYGKSEITAENLIGIFRCYLNLGDSLLDAYEKTLFTHVKAYEEQ